MQLHLRAKLIEQPSDEGAVFTGKVWLKFYTWMPEGYGVVYGL